MENSLPKKSSVKYILFHSMFINLFLFPGLFFYSILYSIDYLSLYEWVKSICFNLICWQVVSYDLRNDKEGSSTLKFELKKYSSLVWFNRVLLNLLSRRRTRIYLFKSLIWFALIVNFFLPIVASVFFNFPISKLTIGLLFISFQLITIVIYYLNHYFPQDLQNSEKPIASPWILEIIYEELTHMKLA